MKKIILSALAGIFALSLAACGTAAEDVQTTADAAQAEISECHCPTKWQHTCCEYLNNLDFLAGGIYFGDINGDDTPETIVKINPFDSTKILYRGKFGADILDLSTASAWGYVRYIADTKQILYCPFYGHTYGTWGYEEYYLWSWNDSGYKITSSIFRESGAYYIDENDEEHSEFGQAYIDDKPVDNDTFEVKLAEIQKLRDENDYFPVIKTDDENFESYMKENFPCFNNWDIIALPDGN